MCLIKYWLLLSSFVVKKQKISFKDKNRKFHKSKNQVDSISLIVIFRVENARSYQYCSRAGFLMTGARAKRLIAEAEHTRRDSTLPYNQYLSGVLREKSEEKVKLILPSSNW